MHYKTILVHLEAGAHLVGSAPTGVSRFVTPAATSAAGPAVAARSLALHDAAVAALRTFERIVREEAVPSSEARLVDDDVDAALALQAHYCDLVVVGQPDHTVVEPPFPADLPARLALRGGRPVLVIPRSGARQVDGSGAPVAWDGGCEATRAVTGALPLRRGARRVTVLDFGDMPSRAGIVEDPCAALCAWLARHGVVARCGRRPARDGRLWPTAPARNGIGRGDRHGLAFDDAARVVGPLIHFERNQPSLR